MLVVSNGLPPTSRGWMVNAWRSFGLRKCLGDQLPDGTIGTQAQKPWRLFDHRRHVVEGLVRQVL